MYERKENFKYHFPRQNLLRGSTFPPSVKAKNQLQNLKTPQTNMMRHKTLKCSKENIFEKK